MKKIFVVSCQALEDEPLYGKGIMTKMAQAALIGGADWIRTSQLDNVIDIKKNIKVPIIGLIKKVYPDSPIHIGASLLEMKQLIETGVDIIAIDATTRNRPNGETLAQLVTYFKKHKQKHQKLMADCSMVSDGVNAQKLGFDFIGTTLVGYTDQTKGQSLKQNNFAILKEFRKSITLPLVAEGKIETPEEAKSAYDHGADIVVVGGAITRPRLIVKRFIEKIK